LELKADEEKQKQAELIAKESENNTQIVEKIDVPLDNETITIDTFNSENVELISETPLFEKNVNNAVIVGITSLQHHNGATHTSFEIAEFLRQQCENPCIVLFNSATYVALSDFHKVPFAKSKSGFDINKIPIYPQNMLDTAMQKHSFVICDFGFYDDISQKEIAKNIENSDIKIMLCSSADWNLRDTMTFLNSANVNGKKDIFNMFYPVSKSKFVRLNRQFLKVGCRAFRLQNSPDCIEPCKENREVYSDILRLKKDGTKRKPLKKH
jgi:hypothetical protein